jgi:dTDP-4-amino-4,6-dideoxygalactose transaminase
MSEVWSIDSNFNSRLGEAKMIYMAKPQIGDEEKQAVMEVLDSGMIAQGPRVKAFEDAFAEMCGVKHAIATTSGTTALHVALLAHGIGQGDEVITSAFTFIASANSILFTGAKPVFVDIDPRTFNIDPDKIEAAITPKTKAIMPVHLYGLACDMDPILSIAEKHGLAIIEDACQSHGAVYKGKKAGSFGTGTFSLYPTKNITSGEGGMITTNDPVIDEKCRVIRQHGMRRRYYHDELGYNFRMTDVHAAIGLAQLKKLDKFNSIRQTNAKFLSENLKGVVVPYVPDEQTHVFHQFTVRVPNGKRDALRSHLQENGVGSEVYYPVPIHQQSFYVSDLEYNESLPETENAAQEVLSLPVHAGLTPSDLETIVAALNEFTDGN